MDHVILLQVIEQEDSFIFVIITVHDESGRPQKCSYLFDSVKRDRIYRFVIFLRRRMNPEKILTGCLLVVRTQASVTW